MAYLKTRCSALRWGIAHVIITLINLRMRRGRWLAVIKKKGLRVWVVLKQNGEEPRQTDNGRDMANRRTVPERAGWDGELATRRYPRAGTRGELPGKSCGSRSRALFLLVDPYLNSP